MKANPTTNARPTKSAKTAAKATATSAKVTQATTKTDASAPAKKRSRRPKYVPEVFYVRQRCITEAEAARGAVGLIVRANTDDSAQPRYVDMGSGKSYLAARWYKVGAEEAARLEEVSLDGQTVRGQPGWRARFDVLSENEWLELRERATKEIDAEVNARVQEAMRVAAREQLARESALQSFAVYS